MDPGHRRRGDPAARSTQPGVKTQAGRDRRRRPRRDHQEDPDRAREGAAGARADALGSGAARAVRHGVGGAGLPDPRSRRRRRGDERAARRRQARADRVEAARPHRRRARARRSSTSTPSRCTTRSRSTIPTRCAASSALVNIGHEVTNINILDDGVPILTRDITVGTRRFREDLQRERGISAPTRREQLLQGYDRSPHLDAVLESRGEEIAVGIERAAAFLASSSRSGGADARGLHLRRRRPHPRAHRRARRPAAPLGRSRPTRSPTSSVRDGALDSLVTDEVAPLLMLPIGLALARPPERAPTR